MRLALFLLVISGCGNPTIIDGKEYTKSCSVASDCVGVFFGNQCEPCGCPNAAISSSDKLKYDADRSAARAACGPRPAIACAPCQDKAVSCTQGVCGL